MLPQVVLRSPLTDGSGQIVLDLLVFAAHVLDAGRLGSQPLKLLFALGPALPQQLLAALLQPGDGLLALGPRAAELAQTAANGLAAGDAGLLPCEHLGEFQDLLHRMLRLDLHAAIGHELGHAAVKHVAFAAALAEFLVQQREAGLHVADAGGKARHLADVAGREVLRQAGLFEALAPGPPGGAEVFLGLGRAARGCVGVLAGGSMPRMQGGQVFQRRQFPLRRGQPAGHRSAAAGKLVVQHGPLVLDLLDLHLQHPQLFLPLFKLLVVGPLHHNLASTAPTAISMPTAVSVQKPVPVHD